LPEIPAGPDFAAMNPLLLKTLHLAGALGVFTAIGAIVAGTCEKSKKFAFALLLLLLMGLHMLFSLKLAGTGGWWHAKIVLWLFLGAAPALAKRKVLPAPALIGLTLAAGIGAAYLGLAKPF
jgi:hypothetical protein